MKEQIQKNNANADLARRTQENKQFEKQQQDSAGKAKKEDGKAKKKENKPQAKKPVKQKGTVYLYRITEHTKHNYAFEDNQASNKYLREVIGPEVLRILNNNWLAIEFDVKVISQKEASKLDSLFLFHTNSAIMGITRRRDDLDYKRGLDKDYSTYANSSVSRSNGLTDPDAEFTYLNLINVYGDAKELKVSSDYFLAYTIAHECLHQLQYAALSKLNQPTDEKHQKFHTDGWGNLNEDGYYLAPNGHFNPAFFKTPMPGSTGLKNTAEWIPLSIKEVINKAAAKNEKH